MTEQTVTFKKALKALSDELTYDGQVWDSDLQQMVPGNVVAWAQRFVIQGVVDTAQDLLKSTEKRLGSLVQSHRQAARAATDEVGSNRVAQLEEMIERQQLQVAFANLLCIEAAEHFESVTGEKYEPRAQRIARFRAQQFNLTGDPVTDSVRTLMRPAKPARNTHSINQVSDDENGKPTRRRA